MRLTVVGCSGSVPGPDSACSCYLVERDGYRLVLDLGTGAAGPLQRHVAAADVDAVIVSHVHGDHWSDLPHLGYLRTLSTPYHPLPVVGPSDMPEVLRTNPDVFTASVADSDQRDHRAGRSTTWPRPPRSPAARPSSPAPACTCSCSLPRPPLGWAAGDLVR
jgi:ribonuclease BN (tRNA processing enzyme)